MELEYVANILQTYTLDDILELNDITLEETLLFLAQEEFLKLPNPEPL